MALVTDCSYVVVLLLLILSIIVVSVVVVGGSVWYWVFNAVRSVLFRFTIICLRNREMMLYFTFFKMTSLCYYILCLSFAVSWVDFLSSKIF